MRLWSWNVGRTTTAWQTIAEDPTVDVALLQEALRPPEGFPFAVAPTPDDSWGTLGSTDGYRTAVVWRGDRVDGRAQPLGALGDDSQFVFCVSRAGTLTAVDIRLGDETLTVVSAYAFWEVAQSEREQLWAYTDASAHRLVSDIAALIDSERDHRVLVAGDLNVLYGYGDDDSAYWKARYTSVFHRLDALGLSFVGPQAPDGGRQPDPWPAELPRDSRNVVTCHSRTQTPVTGTRQLDYVFASRDIADRVRVKALNGIDEWGPSDHCRLQIDIQE